MKNNNFSKVNLKALYDKLSAEERDFLNNRLSKLNSEVRGLRNENKLLRSSLSKHKKVVKVTENNILNVFSEAVTPEGKTGLLPLDSLLQLNTDLIDSDFDNITKSDVKDLLLAFQFLIIGVKDYRSLDKKVYKKVRDESSDTLVFETDEKGQKIALPTKRERINNAFSKFNIPLISKKLD